MSFFDFSTFSAAITSPTRRSSFRKSEIGILASEEEGTRERFLEGEEEYGPPPVPARALQFQQPRHSPRCLPETPPSKKSSLSPSSLLPRSSPSKQSIPSRPPAETAA